MAKVDDIEAHLPRDLTRMDAVRFLQKLDKKDYGRFIVGRRGAPSRFEWRKSPAADTPALPTGPADSAPHAPAIEADSLEPRRAVRELRHQLPLRPDYIAELRLPIDLTEREAERLATFIKSLSV